MNKRMLRNKNGEPKTKNMEKQKVLFVCTHNSSRSQMAEGLMHAYYGDRYDVYSAGTQPSGVNRFAIEAKIGRAHV